MINAEIRLIFKWTQDCVLKQKATRETKATIPAQGGTAAVDAVIAVNTPSDLKFNIIYCKLYVPVVTL